MSAPVQKYVARHGYSDSVYTILVERETDHYYWLANQRPGCNRRHKKRTDYETLCDTFEEAKALCIRKQQKRVEAAERRLASERASLEDSMNLKCPTKIRNEA